MLLGVGTATASAHYVAAGAVALTELDLMIVRSETAYYETGTVEIVYGNDEKNLIHISNFLSSGERIVATLDADGNIAIAPQLCGSDDMGNYRMIVNAGSVNGLPFEISNTRLKGKFDGTTLTLEPWNLITVPYSFAENLGTYFPENVTSTFVKSNGSMKFDISEGIAVETPVYAEESGNGGIDVYGWGLYAMVTVQKSGSSRTIDSSAGAFWCEGAEYNVVAPDGSDVVSVDVPDAQTIVFGAWQLRNVVSGDVAMECLSAKLSFDFELPGTTDIDAAVAESAVVGTTYYNATGVGAPVPFNGFNIRVDVHSDGTVRTTKLIVKDGSIRKMED